METSDLAVDWSGTILDGRYRILEQLGRRRRNGKRVEHRAQRADVFRARHCRARQRFIDLGVAHFFTRLATGNKKEST